MAQVENEEVSGLPAFDIEFLTDGPTKECSVKWTLKKFSQLPTNEEFASNPFKPILFCEWKLYFTKGDDQLFLYAENKFEKEITAYVKTVILDTKEKRWFTNKKTTYFPSNEKTDILSCVKSIYHKLKTLDDDTLIFMCSFTILEQYTTISKSASISKNYDGLVKLAEDLRTFCIDKRYVDVTLKSSDGEIPANKAILSARSPVFDRMFRHDSCEEENDIVEIDDVTSTVLKKLVDFLYTGELNAESDYESAKALHYAAGKYEVFDLRKMCGDTLMSMVTVENAIETLVVADGHGDEDLKNKVFAFLYLNMRNITQSKKWEDLVRSQTKLAAEVIKYYFTQ